jgi:hypothetical protein
MPILLKSVLHLLFALNNNVTCMSVTIDGVLIGDSIY